jgi:hypothetical protein
MEVIGSGGYGIVIDIPDENRVIKLFKDNVCKTDARKEYDAHLKIYTIFNRFIELNPTFNTILYIPKPIEFKSCSKLGNCYGFSDFSCAYVMEKVTSARPDQIQEHLILNNDNSHLFGKIFCADYGKPPFNIYTELTKEQKSECKPRGAFLGPESIQSRIGQDLFSNLPFFIGILYGIVLKSGYHPIDLEIVVDKDNRICMYDFGKVYEGESEYNRAKELDMYLPVGVTEQLEKNQKGEKYDISEEMEKYQKGVELVNQTLKNINGGRRKKARRTRKRHSRKRSV